ncbi:MAG: GNAT family N-acetyltransferase [Ekhidna sp.]
MIQTERLYLRIIQEEDASFLYQLMNTSKWHQHIGDRKIQSEADAIQYMQDRMHPDLKVKGFVNHVMIEKASGASVGTCSLHNREGVVGMDVGYALLPQFEGNGYAAEGAKAMVNHAFNVYDQSKIHAITNEENTGSCRLLEKLGFVQQGYADLPHLSEHIRLYSLERKADSK